MVEKLWRWADWTLNNRSTRGGSSDYGKSVFHRCAPSAKGVACQDCTVFGHPGIVHFYDRLNKLRSKRCPRCRGSGYLIRHSQVEKIAPELIRGTSSGVHIDEASQRMNAAVRKLRPRLRRLIYRHYVWEPAETIREHAEKMGISPGRYSQLHTEALIGIARNLAEAGFPI